MELQTMINDFTSEYGYVAEINNFIGYLQDHESENITTTILGGIRTKDIITSIDYNIKVNHYNSESIAKKYVSALAQFFRYAVFKREWFKNDNLMKEIDASGDFDSSSYSMRTGEYIKQHPMLREKTSKEVLSESDVNLLLLDIDNELLISGRYSSDLAFEQAGARICVKLMLFTGIKYSVATKIVLGDVDIYANTIDINSFCIRLPINLSRQMRVYVEQRLSMKNNNKDDCLFVDCEGEGWNERATTDSRIPEIIKASIERADLTGVFKYGISKLLLAGTSIKEVEKISGARKDIIQGCVLASGEEYKNRLNKSMNMNISKMDIFYRL